MPDDVAATVQAYRLPQPVADDLSKMVAAWRQLGSTVDAGDVAVESALRLHAIGAVEEMREGALGRRVYRPVLALRCPAPVVNRSAPAHLYPTLEGLTAAKTARKAETNGQLRNRALIGGLLDVRGT